MRQRLSYLLWMFIRAVIDLRRTWQLRHVGVVQSIPLVESSTSPITEVSGAGRRDARLRRVLSYMHTCSADRHPHCLACRCLEILDGRDRAVDDHELRILAESRRSA